MPTAGSESAARLASGQPAEASGPASTRDLVDYMKRQGLAVPFTTYGAERYKNADMAKNPNSHCLPPGPSRALTGPSPFLIVQHDQKTGPDSIKYTVTYTDPVFFTKPWSASLSFQRQGKDDRLMEYVCNDNEKDRARLVPTLRDQ